MVLGSNKLEGEFVRVKPCVCAQAWAWCACLFTLLELGELSLLRVAFLLKPPDFLFRQLLAVRSELRNWGIQILLRVCVRAGVRPWACAHACV